MEKSWKSFSILKTSGKPCFPSTRFPPRQRFHWTDTSWLDEEIYPRPFSHVFVLLPAVIFQQPGIRGGESRWCVLSRKDAAVASHRWVVVLAQWRTLIADGRCQNRRLDSYGSTERTSMEWPNERVATPAVHYGMCTFSNIWVTGTSVNLFAYCKPYNDYCSLSQMDNDSI